MDEQQRLEIVQEIETFRYSWDFNPERLSELLSICESVEFGSNSGLVASVRRQLLDCLISILSYSSKIRQYPALVQKIESVFLCFATVSDIYNACQSWVYHQDGLLEDFIERQNWLDPYNWIKLYPHSTSMARIAILFYFKKGWFKDITDFLADKNFSDYRNDLARGLTQYNPVIRKAALTYFRQLNAPKQKLISDALVNEYHVLDYAETLDWLAEQKCYPPNNNMVRLVVSLINGVFAEHNAENETTVRLLLEIVQTNKGHERNVPDKAKTIIRNLPNIQLREYFCRLVFETLKDGKSHKEVEALAVEIEIGYTPSVLPDKILYLFLTRQFEKYDKLDFDRSIMYTLYTTTENKGLRHHINATVRESGRLDYLDIVTPRTEVSNSKLITNQQTTTIKILRSNKQWAQLWLKVFDFSFWGSVSALGVLRKSNWRPDNEYERELFVRLTGILRTGILRELQLNPASLVERPFGIRPMNI
jgi:hypothetical protein